MARDPARNHHTAMALHQRLIDAGEGAVAEVARKTGVSKSILYAYCENEATLPAFLVGPICEALGDTGLIADLVRWPGLIAVAPLLGDESPESLRTTALEAGAAVGQLQTVVRDATRDGVIEAREATMISVAVERSKRWLEKAKQLAVSLATGVGRMA